MITGVDISFTELIGTVVGILGLVIVPIIIFMARLWQQVKSNTYQIKAIDDNQRLSVATVIKNNEIFTPLFQKAVIDIAIVKEKIDNIESHLYDKWKPIHNKDGGYNDRS